MSITIERLDDNDSASPWNPLRTGSASESKLRTCAYRIHGTVAPEGREECSLMVPLPFRGTGFDFYKKVKPAHAQFIKNPEYVLIWPPQNVTIDMRVGNYCVFIEPVPLLVFVNYLTVDFPILNLGVVGKFILKNNDKKATAQVDFKLVGIEISRQ